VARVAQAQRPDTTNSQELWRFNTGDVVETYESENFIIHYTRAGEHAVPSADADQSGVPDHVENLSELYEDVLATYVGMGFRPPVSDEGVNDGNGGDGRYDVYLVDFGLSADGAFRNEACLNENPDICTGYMVQENDFAGYGYPSANYANKVLASHEFFHFIQAAYDVDQNAVIGEGSAVWASEQYDETLFDLEGFSDSFLENPDRSVNVPMPGPVAGYNYGSAVFFQFLTEFLQTPDVIVDLWDHTVNGAGGIDDPDWFEDALPIVLSLYGATFEDIFVEFAKWNLYTGSYADPEVSYQSGAFLGAVAMEDVDPPFSDDRLRVYPASTHYFKISPQGRPTMTAALVVTPDNVDELEDLHLLLIRRSGGSIAEVVEVDLESAETALSTTSGDFVVAVVNTAMVGESQRPGLCIGAPEEVESCRAALVGATGDGDGDGDGDSDGGIEEPTDGGSSPDAGGIGGDGDEVPDDCGCSGSKSEPTLFGAFAILLLAWRRRVR